MEKKIEITEIEKSVLLKSLNGTFFPPECSDEEIQAMHTVLDKAEDLMEELDAYDELDNSLLEWFWGKYQTQETKA